MSVVVPTRNEAGNVEVLVDRLDAALRPRPFEIVFVDDSDDDTPQVIEDVARRSPLRIRLVHRPADRRADGLGGAVVEGLRAARAPWVCVMDGDLQHPPELVPELLERAAAGDADVVIASRFRGHRRTTGLALPRRLASHGLIGLTRALFPRRLRGVSDPLTGFFLVRSAAVEVTGDVIPPAVGDDCLDELRRQWAFATYTPRCTPRVEHGVDSIQRAY